MTHEARLHAHSWDGLAPQVQAAINRELAKTRAAEDLDPECCRRLASMLGLSQGGAS